MFVVCFLVVKELKFKSTSPSFPTILIDKQLHDFLFATIGGVPFIKGSVLLLGNYFL